MVGGWCSFLHLSSSLPSTYFFFQPILEWKEEREDIDTHTKKERCCCCCCWPPGFSECLVGWRRRSANRRQVIRLDCTYTITGISLDVSFFISLFSFSVNFRLFRKFHRPLPCVNCFLKNLFFFVFCFWLQMFRLPIYKSGGHISLYD